MPKLTFEQAWSQKEAEGYQYGEEALAQVRFGWELRQPEVDAAETNHLYALEGIKDLNDEIDTLQIKIEGLQAVLNTALERNAQLEDACDAFQEASGQACRDAESAERKLKEAQALINTFNLTHLQEWCAARDRYLGLHSDDTSEDIAGDPE
jgi:hypothetical protein